MSPFEITGKYCEEVDFEINDKRFFAVGFENSSGGFELRNQHFKGSSSPKDIPKFVFLPQKKLQFRRIYQLSFLPNTNQKDPQLPNFLVPNSLSFFEKCRQLMEENQKVYLYLDRDEAGIKNTQTALRWDAKYSDRSYLYKNHKDLNDYLLYENQKLKPGLRSGRHL